MEKVFYLCNGKKADCKKRTCYINGGNCRHTSDVECALNFERTGKYKNGHIYEKRGWLKKQDILNRLNKVRQKTKNIFQTIFKPIFHENDCFVRKRNIVCEIVTRIANKIAL